MVCIPPPNKCIRATSLHKASCSNDETGCSDTVGNENTVTFGNLGTKGTLTSGDAFDCDVNGDGDFSEETERFYYVSDLYTGTIEGVDTFDNEYAVLIYYSNVIIDGNTITQNNTIAVAYDLSIPDFYGPITAIEHLPNKVKEQWNNVNLKSQIRQIYSENGTNFHAGGIELLPQYTYTNKAARLLTVQELNKACNITVGSYTTGELDTCSYLLENTKYINDENLPGYWLETTDFNGFYSIWSLYSHYRLVGDRDKENDEDYGVRPVIEVLKSDIAY